MREEIYNMIENDNDPRDHEYITYLSKKYRCSEQAVRNQVYSAVFYNSIPPKPVNPLISWMES